jgi:hypothetical protein
MPQIVRFTKPVDDQEVPGPPKLGKQFVFTDDLASDPAGTTVVGTHSGFATLVRGEPHFLQYQATYDLKAATRQQKGQLTVRGLVAFSDVGKFVGSPKVAITGGTEAYDRARGQVTWEATADLTKHTIDIVL